MKKFILILGIVSLIVSCADVTKKTEEKAINNTDVSDKLIETPLIALADFDSKAGEWVDKEVQVKGIVDHVCKHGGKKILLVNDEGDVHIESDTRFDDALVGSEITVNGVVTEFRVDEAYLLKKEEDHIQNHKDGTDSKDVYEEKMQHLQDYRDEMKATNVNHLSFYSLDYISHKVDEVAKETTEEKSKE